MMFAALALAAVLQDAPTAPKDPIPALSAVECRDMRVKAVDLNMQIRELMEARQAAWMVGGNIALAVRHDGDKLKKMQHDYDQLRHDFILGCTTGIEAPAGF